MERAINFAETEDNHKEAWVKIISQNGIEGWSRLDYLCPTHYETEEYQVKVKSTKEETVMISKDTEYSMLKQEIISTTDIISNITLAMYTITVSIIVLAIETENAVIFWLLILFCIPFRILSTEKRRYQ